MPQELLGLDLVTLRRVVRQILKEANLPIRFVDQIDRRGQYVRMPNDDIRQVPIANASKRALLNLLRTYTERNREEGERNEMGAEDARVNPPRVRDLLRIVEELRQQRPQGVLHETQEREDMMNQDYLLQRRLGMISSIPTAPLTIPIGEHPRFKKYFMMKRSNIPVPVIQRKMMQDGMSRDDVELLASSSSDSPIKVGDEMREQVLERMAERERQDREEQEHVASIRRQQEEEMKAQLERERAFLGQIDADEMRDAMLRRRSKIGEEETKGSGFHLLHHARRIYYRRFV
jgi:hypothetical protein